LIRYLAILVLLSLAVNDGPSHPNRLQSAKATANGAERLKVVFESLPQDWVAASIRMDTIWTPLHLHGFNNYAFGGPIPPNDFAARSDPSSQVYQAWLGVYTIDGGKDFFRSGNPDLEFSELSRVAELDQRAWLDGMGDPRPLASWRHKPAKSKIIIDGVDRPLFFDDMDSHSDLGSTPTEVSKQLGRPPVERWTGSVDAYHDLVLHCYYSLWYDSAHDVTIILYAVSSSFRDKSGAVHDNRAALDPILLDKMKSIRLHAD
jgi:hypothetical protein